MRQERVAADVRPDRISTDAVHAEAIRWPDPAMSVSGDHRDNTSCAAQATARNTTRPTGNQWSLAIPAPTTMNARATCALSRRRAMLLTGPTAPIAVIAS